MTRSEEPSFAHVFGSDDASEEDLWLAARVDVPVLVTADREQERERCARYLHAARQFGHGPFVIYGGNGAAVHDPGEPEAGGATDELLRKFHEASDGTFYIDDITVLSPAEQAHLLRLLEEHVASRDPGAPPGRRRVHIIAGASPRLAAKRGSGAFSDSLFFRLNLIQIDLFGTTATATTPDERSTENVGNAQRVT